MSVVTRFAPSPTGSLHLGGARTALFNWLFARHHGGRFLLRMEDTDQERSSEDVARSIIEDLSWLGLHHDQDVVVQSTRKERHVQVAKELLASNKAYYCYCSEDEIAHQRIEFEKEGKYYRHCCPWKDNNSRPHNTAVAGVIRLKSPEAQEIQFTDGVYGKISVNSAQIDDMVILRSNGYPTYLLAVVTDDHDMGITHIIRGSDHITNTVKQILLAEAMGWNSPKFCHIPLIHDEGGTKLSKRNRAPGVHEYRKLGFLPEAVCNYLLRMGWSHKDEEIIAIQNAIQLFSIENIGTSHACLDSKKLLFLNRHYMNHKSEDEVSKALLPFLEQELGYPVPKEKIARLSLGLKKLTERASTLVDLARDSVFYVQDVPISVSDEAKQTISEKLELLAELVDSMLKMEQKTWTKECLSSYIKEYTKRSNIEISNIYHLLRAAIVGRLSTPSILEIMEILGQEECIGRLRFFLK
ncbi:glutamate--tRNA ligase [Anaplasma capra]|uniref:glutamate--tRNA ligase n=1 Tax=Anaplasma capra TaxID=1562740 RepID=UPI0021D5E244|nr:glutamate--tRNA ligase [Anaplasma capra]MCU7611569.1 glutamate--tRNA ligase [Anaplasma capra]MCU7611992.1 glutamate--tRNA ligase [Anaplasma capra]